VRDLQLVRSPDDKRRLDLAGVGSVRFENMWGTKLVIVAPGSGEWRIDGRGPFRRASVVTDAGQDVIASFAPGRIEYGGRVVEATTPHQGMLERRPPFQIVEGGRAIARVTPRVWDEKPLDLTVLDEEFVASDPLLFLLALYVANLISVSRAAGASAGGVG
jgi:hypothetical protein